MSRRSRISIAPGAQSDEGLILNSSGSGSREEPVGINSDSESETESTEIPFLGSGSREEPVEINSDSESGKESTEIPFLGSGSKEKPVEINSDSESEKKSPEIVFLGSRSKEQPVEIESEIESEAEEVDRRQARRQAIRQARQAFAIRITRPEDEAINRNIRAQLLESDGGPYYTMMDYRSDGGDCLYRVISSYVHRSPDEVRTAVCDWMEQHYQDHDFTATARQYVFIDLPDNPDEQFWLNYIRTARDEERRREEESWGSAFEVWVAAQIYGIRFTVGTATAYDGFFHVDPRNIDTAVLEANPDPHMTIFRNSDSGYGHWIGVRVDGSEPAPNNPHQANIDDPVDKYTVKRPSRTGRKPKKPTKKTGGKRKRPTKKPSKKPTGEKDTKDESTHHQEVSLTDEQEDEKKALEATEGTITACGSIPDPDNPKRKLGGFAWRPHYTFQLPSGGTQHVEQSQLSDNQHRLAQLFDLIGTHRPWGSKFTTLPPPRSALQPPPPSAKRGRDGEDKDGDGPVNKPKRAKNNNGTAGTRKPPPRLAKRGRDGEDEDGRSDGPVNRPKRAKNNNGTAGTKKSKRIEEENRSASTSSKPSEASGTKEKPAKKTTKKPTKKTTKKPAKKSTKNKRPSTVKEETPASPET